jgi:carbonic anhydrase
VTDLPLTILYFIKSCLLIFKKGDPKALAVLGLFLTYGKEDTDANEAVDLISTHIPLQYKPQLERVKASLDLKSILPKAGSTFFRYSGSLTTPNCSEIVEWTIIEDPIPVKPSDIKKFHQVLNNNGIPTGRNWRPVQPLGQRDLQYLSTKMEKASTGAKTFIPVYLMLLSLIILKF